MKQGLFLILILEISTVGIAQTTTRGACVHNHCDNPRASIANCETIHRVSQDGIQDYRKIKGQLSFKINGVVYESSGTKAQFYVVKSNFMKITIMGKLNDSSQLLFTYRVKPKTPVGRNLNSSAFVSYGVYQINLGRTVYTYSDGGTNTNAPLNINVNCAYYFGRYNYLLNGVFEGELFDKNGRTVQITEGKFCSDTTQ